MKRFLLFLAAMGIVWGAEGAPRTFIRTLVTNDIHNVLSRPLCEFPTYAISWTLTNCTVSMQDDVSLAIAAGDTIVLKATSNLFSSVSAVVTNVSAGTNLIFRFGAPWAGSVSETNGTVTVRLLYRKALVLGMSSASATNAGSVYLGTATNSTPYEVALGDSISVEPPEAHPLNDWWLKAGASGDGVAVIYWP